MVGTFVCNFGIAFQTHTCPIARVPRAHVTPANLSLKTDEKMLVS